MVLDHSLVVWVVLDHSLVVWVWMWWHLGFLHQMSVGCCPVGSCGECGLVTEGQLPSAG